MKARIGQTIRPRRPFLSGSPFRFGPTTPTTPGIWFASLDTSPWLQALPRCWEWSPTSHLLQWWGTCPGDLGDIPNHWVSALAVPPEAASDAWRPQHVHDKIENELENGLSRMRLASEWVGTASTSVLSSLTFKCKCCELKMIQDDLSIFKLHNS